MIISQKDWNAYIERLSKLNTNAAQKMEQYVEKNGTANVTDLINYAYGLVTLYGEASSALAAEMYDVIAELEASITEPAVMAEPAGYDEISKTINGILKNSVNAALIGGAIGRLVKQAGADTTIRNAIRDKAQFAWIPVGDTCPYCLGIAARGWQTARAEDLHNGHAEHIHANCNCMYSTRFTKDSGVSGYDPREYREMFADADTSSYGFGSVNNDRDVEKLDWQSMWTARINGLRREEYAKNKDMINAQKRAAYAERKAAIEAGEIPE